LEGLAPRNRAPQRRTELGFLQIGIPKRRTNVAMTEHPLDNFDALSLRKEFAAARMSQLVRCTARREDNGALDAILGFSDAECRPPGFQNDMARAQLQGRGGPKSSAAESGP